MPDISQFSELVNQAAADVSQNGADRDALRTKYLGRKGALAALMETIRVVPSVERQAWGRAANEAKAKLTEMLQTGGSTKAVSSFDPTLPGSQSALGRLHPITQTMMRIAEIFTSLGYSITQNPEVETDYVNFEGLNMPPHHPARDVQDTFYIADHPHAVLRTHCSTTQMRTAWAVPPPIKALEIGRVYRNEATDATHEASFFQYDAFVVDRHIRMTDLLGTLQLFFDRFFGRPMTLRFRPHYYPFVEPGMDVDLLWESNGKKQWLEMLGSGLIHPTVIKNMKLKPAEWTGFAFGGGVDRLMMLQQGIDDVRWSHRSDIRFLQQF